MRETNHLAPVSPGEGQWAIPLITDLGGAAFHATLLAGLRDMVGADHVTDLCYGPGGSLRYCAAASLLNQALIEWTSDLYVNGSFYRRDPNYALLCDVAEQRQPQRGPIIASLLPAHIGDAEYRKLLFERPGFASKVSIIGAHNTDTSYINLYFSRSPGPGVTELMHACAPMLLALSQRHRELTRPAALADLPCTASWASGLSLREIQVGELLRQGRTAKQVGRELGLSPATVVTYKNRIYRKNQVASLKEFLVKV